MRTRDEPPGDRPGSELEILFVCTANVSRSAFADGLLNHRAAPGVRAASAGTHGRGGDPMDPPMAAQLVARGVSAAAFRSRRLAPEMLERADLVLTMETAHRDLLLRSQPPLARKAFTLGQFDRTLHRLGTSAPGVRGRDLLREASRYRAQASPQDDVVDVYGRGDEQAARAAASIEAYVDRMLRRLAPWRATAEGHGPRWRR